MLWANSELQIKNMVLFHPLEFGDHVIDRLDAVLRVVARAHADGVVALLLRADDEARGAARLTRARTMPRSAHHPRADATHAAPAAQPLRI